MTSKSKLFFIYSIIFILGKTLVANADTTNNDNSPILDSVNQEFINGLSSNDGPPIYKLTPTQARKVLSDIQAKSPPSMSKVDVEEKEISADNTKFKLYIVRPKGNNKTLPAILYFHGGGWVMGDKDTHSRLINELACGVQAAVIFVDYGRSPETQYPTPINQAYAATKWVAENAKSINVNPSKLAVAGDSVGGNMAIAVTLLAKKAQSPKINFQLLFYPVTDSSFDTESYNKFANGPWLTKDAMKWFWDAYLPDVKARNDILASPLKASIDDLKGLPKALVITDENDVLRDEGEAYARKLLQAGVKVTATRYLGTTHDFVLFNAYADALPTRAAIAQAIAELKEALK